MPIACSCNEIRSADVINAFRHGPFTVDGLEDWGLLKRFYMECVRQSFIRREIDISPQETEKFLPQCGTCWASAREEFTSIIKKALITA